jgi:hypothetical protein
MIKVLVFMRIKRYLNITIMLVYCVVFGTQADPNITWESNNQFDVGLDFAFFNRRIKGSVEWFKRETDGLLFSVPFNECWCTK